VRKLICTVGIQGSGKSTWAREYLTTHPDCYRINGDELRLMANNTQWSPKREKGILTIQEASVKALLASGYNVIWDNMNVSPSAKDRCIWVACEAEAELYWQRFETPLDTCIARDLARGELIGRAIIENTALHYNLIPWGDTALYPRRFIVVDLDGTLCDCDWRRDKFLVVTPERPKKDWKSFLSLCWADRPKLGTYQWVLSLQQDYDIIVVTGRQEHYYPQTAEWLKAVKINYRRIFMRSNEDHRHDWEVKLDILGHLPKSQIEFAIDDRPTVINKVWRAEGVKVYPVGGYNEEW
jgi:predicted kinase